MKNIKKSVICISMFMLFSVSNVAYAAQNQSDRWHVDATGTWYLYDATRTSNVTNKWFQDLDSSWYLLAPGDGHMYAGLIHDTSTDRWYFCQTEHDGWYGRMAHTDGTYTVNGQVVYLTFNQQHDGTFGAITSGLDTLRGTGVETEEIPGIPTESVDATEDEGNTGNSSGNTSSSDNSSNSNSSYDPSLYSSEYSPRWSGTHQEALDYLAEFGDEFDRSTYRSPEEQAARMQSYRQWQQETWGPDGYRGFKGGAWN